MNPPEEVVAIAATLRGAGFEAWCVGGAVRDALLGHAHLDWDLATSARPEDVRKLFKRTIPVGVEFGTVGVLDRTNVMHEVTTFRKDVKTDGRHAVVEFGVSLDDDLARRDFTINAIAYDPADGVLRDPFDGQTDLKRGIVRAVGAPSDRMREDRLRALRGIRFAARFGFHIEPATWEAIRESAPHLGRLSAERVKQELEKTMQQVAHPSVALEWWRESGALATLVPSLAAAPVVRFRALDFVATADGRSATRRGDPDGRSGHRPGDPEGKSVARESSRWVAVGDAPSLLGPADPKGATLDRLTMLFFGGDAKSVDQAVRALKFSNADSAWIVALAKARRELGDGVDAALSSGDTNPAQLRRWVAAIGRTRTDTFFRLVGALHLAAAARPAADSGEWTVDDALRVRLDAFRAAAVEVAFRDPIELADLAVDGEDLRAAGIADGPEMGRVLKLLLQRVIDDPAQNTPAGLVAIAKQASAPRS